MPNRSGRHETGKRITTPSWFGSHASMVVDCNDPEVEGFNFTLSEDQVLCKDDTGFYVTLKSRLDTGNADPARYGAARQSLS